MAIWYVDPTASATSDAYDGSFGVGKLRLSWGAVTWTSSDSYYQRRGTTVTLTANLTPGGNSVTIGAYGDGDRPIILSNGATPVFYGMYFSAGSNVTVIDLHFVMTNRGVGYAGIRIGGTTNFSLRNCVIEGFDVGIFITASAVNTIIDGNEVFDCGDDGLVIGATNAGRITNNQIYGTSRRVTTGDCIQFLDAVDWGAWRVDSNTLTIDVALKQCVMIGVPASATQVPVVVEQNECTTTCNGIHARHSAVIRANTIEITGVNAALIANAGLSNQPILFSGNVVRCIGASRASDQGAGIVAMAVYADAGAGIAHLVSFVNNTVAGDAYRGFFAGADIDSGTITLRNNLLWQTFGNPSVGFSVNAGAAATFVESNTAIYGFTSPAVNLTLSSPDTSDPSPYLNADYSLRAINPGDNPLSNMGTYVQGTTLRNGRARPGWTPVGAYMGVVPRATATSRTTATTRATATSRAERNELT